MKKLHKNFKSSKETVESMICPCACPCSSYCTTIYNWTGVAIADMSTAVWSSQTA